MIHAIVGLITTSDYGVPMKVVNVSPSGEGKRTRITVELSPEHAKALVKLFESGQLASLGITNLSSEPISGERTTRTGWTEKERPENRPDASDPLTRK